jgi:hypothetical protein
MASKIKINNIIATRLFESKKKRYTAESVFPIKINGYEFLKKYIPQDSSKLYYYGTYKNSKGKLAFAKIWKGKKKDSSYFWLNNEINVYKEIQDLYKRDGKFIKKYFPEIVPPKFINAKQTDDELILLMQNLGGKLLSKSKNDKTKLDTLEHVIEYFNFINKRLKKYQIDGFMKIEGKHVGFAYIYLLLRTFIKKPLALPLVLRAGRVYLLNSSKLLKSKNLELTHRDLFGNIIVDKKKIYVLDFQLTAKTFPLFDITSTELALWKTNLFEKFHSSKFVNKLTTQSANFGLYKTLSIYTALFEITMAQNLSREDAFSYLKWSLSLNLNEA